MQKRKWIPVAIWATILLLPPLLINVWLLLPGMLEVAQTGICPPTPPDSAAYPCRPGDYVLHMTLGSWALPMQMLLLFGWIGIVVPLVAGVYFLLRRLWRISG